MSRQAHVCLVALAILVVAGCSEGKDDDRGGGGKGGFQDPGGSGGAPGGSGGASHGGSGGTSDGGSGGSGGAGGSGGMEVVDPGPTTCAPVETHSVCGNDASIVRVLARLPKGAEPVRGRMKLNLRHVRLGEGESGGYGHVPLGGKAPRFDVDLKPGQNAVAWLDMCEGGEMWSEENCEFNLFAWVDVNNNEEVDAGEPAGRQVISVSCHDRQPPCYTLDLACTDGTRCISFDEPAVCACAQDSCNSPIAICQ